MAAEFNRALYRDRDSVFVFRGDLWKVAIRLWNQGTVFLQIQDVEDADTCWASYKESEPSGFLILPCSAGNCRWRANFEHMAQIQPACSGEHGVRTLAVIAVPENDFQLIADGQRIAAENAHWVGN